MSAYKKIECDIVDKDCLLKALKELGFEPDVHEVAQSLVGYKDDLRPEKAEIIIPKKQVNIFTGASNDIGFKWNETEEKYEFIVSDYDKRLKMHERILQAYAKIVIETALEKNGFKIKVRIQEDQLKQRQMIDLNITARKII